ncbi:MAG: CPBP family intramembrane metalloprotease [Gemmatimonadales bacterium]|nr:MAG: CPBP family intramembrane metalloprotease [Gemmatimonadales bacterium]
MAALGQLLLENRAMKIAELLLLFAVALLTITVVLPRMGENPLARQAVIWVANVLMLALVWLGLRLRGQGWAQFGLSLHWPGRRAALRRFWQSLLVFVAAALAFVIGSIVMANIAGIPESADTSRYDYLRGNLPLLLLALAAVYVVSSFGEEVIYRAFLINRLAELGAGGKWSLRLAVVVSAVIFGLVHFDWGPMGIVQTACMGLALGASYLLLRRRLMVLVLAHAYMDTILLVQMYLPAQ